MILAIDVGNTQIELGVFEQEKLLRSWRIATGADRTEDEYMLFVHHFLAMESLHPSKLEGVAISSVVPNLTFIFEKMCLKYLKHEPVIVNHKLKLGIRINYKNPAAVGADRLCSAVAAYSRYPESVVIVDLGTATTFDVVNSDGVYLGGIISPGLETTAWALYHRAAKLPKISLDFPPTYIGRTSEQSMQAGIMLGGVKMIDGLLDEISTELGETPRVISTGGLAKLIQPRSKKIEAYYPHLTLEGLFRIYQLNK